MSRKNKFVAYLALALTVLVVSPLDDIVFALLFGTVLFGFGTIGFYVITILMTILSVFMWRAHGRKHLQPKEARKLEKSNEKL